jgi:NAD(P)H-dependent flavin oxidoreductase YrpB (nitropropane dioxygenase family)
MIRTRLCDLLGIEHPVIQASIGPWSSAELVATVSNAGGLGSVGTALQTAEDLRKQLCQIHDVLPAGEIVRQMVAGAEEALRRASTSLRAQEN